MTDLEKIEDQHPELIFYGIEVPNRHFHGCIVGNEVYINLLQPDLDWLRTALHECVHSEYDQGNLSDLNQFNVLKSEGWAIKESLRQYRSLTHEEK